MSNVNFKEHNLVTAHHDMTIERIFYAMAEFAGIHSLHFDDDFAEDGSDATQWDTVGAEGTWVATGGVIQGTGTSGYQFCRTNTYTTPKAFTLQCAINGTEGAVMVLATDKDNGVFFWWNSSTQCGIKQRISDSDTALIQLPKQIETSSATLRISVQPAVSATDCFVSVWCNEQFVCNAHLSTYPSGRYLCLGCNDTTQVQFDDIRVPELTEVLEILTLDVGETPAGGLSRAIGRRHINFFIRYDGSMRVWRPKQVSASATLTTADIDDTSEAYDHRQLVSHWRQIGAWDTADAWDESLLASLGHRFHVDDNPDLMTEDDCDTEATNSLTRAQEYAHTMSVQLPYHVLLEPEDRITIGSDDWLITSAAFSIVAGGLIGQFELREYGYG